MKVPGQALSELPELDLCNGGYSSVRRVGMILNMDVLKPAISSNCRFRLSIPALLALNVTSGILLVAWGYFIGINLTWVAISFLLYVVPLSVGTWLICTVEVGPTGIRLSRVNFVSWEEISRVVKSNLLGLRYAKVYRNGRRWAWWVPLYLAKEPDFYEAALKFAPDDNPFQKFIRTLD